ncbi:hypothetical protein HDU86_007118 [Geranomyces michiganensis]|nr:hypothetical protein HDU86_007118 [Geranomyces michiganensis]
MISQTSNAASPEVRRIAYQETYPLRSDILWPHAPSEVLLSADPEGHHWGVFIPTSPTPVSIISLFIEEPHTQARFRKFATAAEVQGKGYGTLLLDHMFREAAAMGVTRIWCSARTNQIGFYTKRGMRTIAGTESSKKGVDHIHMEKDL